MATKTKTISFTDEYMHIKDYLDNLDNASRYICRLVQKDMEDSKTPLPDLIRGILDEQLKKYTLSPTLPTHNKNNNYLKDCVSELF
jgi:hypothetical protein